MIKIIDIVYKNLIHLIEHITLEGAEFDNYYESKSDSEKENLIMLNDIILDIKTDIQKARLEKGFYSNFNNLITQINDFSSHFADYPGFRKNELCAIIYLIQKLCNEDADTEILENEIDLDIFELTELNIDIYQNNFFHYDASDIHNSMLLFNLKNVEDFKIFLDDISGGGEILFHLLGKLGTTSALSNKKYVLLKREFADKPKVTWATLCLHIIKQGQIVHHSSEYTLKPNVTSNCKVTLGKDYQQFADSIDIISEYNYQKDILDKYLRIYHVLENFMYKSPLVSLERDSAGGVFSMRDFKRMYDQISESELAMLKKLFEEILKLPYNSSQNFNSRILSEWNNLVPTYFTDDLKINSLIKILRIYKSKGIDMTFSDVKSETLPQFLSKLIYSFRNSMVHNRETEFHLTHQTLTKHPSINDTAKIVLEKFLLPTMEEIVFNLIIDQNPIVWYNNHTLTLWEKN